MLGPAKRKIYDNLRCSIKKEKCERSRGDLFGKTRLPGLGCSKIRQLQIQLFKLFLYCFYVQVNQFGRVTLFPVILLGIIIFSKPRQLFRVARPAIS